MVQINESPNSDLYGADHANKMGRYEQHLQIQKLLGLLTGYEKEEKAAEITQSVKHL